MKIVYINCLYPPHVRGGAELVLRTQAELMARRGHEVTVLTIGPEPAPALAEQRINDVAVMRCGYDNRYFHGPGMHHAAGVRLMWHLRDRRNPAMADTAQALCQRLDPDVVVCHNLAGWSALVWERLHRLGIPTLQVLHDQYLLCANSMMFRDGHNCASQCGMCRWLRLGHARQSDNVDAVVGVSRFVLDRLLQAGYFSTVTVREVHHNTSERSLPPPDSRLRVPGPLRFGFIGTLAQCKGIELLLQCFEQVSRFGHCQLSIAGRGESGYEQALRSRYASRRIEFQGFVEPADFFRSIDVTVVPSLWNDTLPSVVFESLGFGVPVIGSRRGGIPEMLRHGFNGLLFDPEVPGELAATLRRCLEQPQLLPQLAHSCRESARSFFDQTLWANRHQSILDATIEAAHRPGMRRSSGRGLAGALQCEP